MIDAGSKCPPLFELRLSDYTWLSVSAVAPESLHIFYSVLKRNLTPKALPTEKVILI